MSLTGGDKELITGGQVNQGAGESEEQDYLQVGQTASGVSDTGSLAGDEERTSRAGIPPGLGQANKFQQGAVEQFYWVRFDAQNSRTVGCGTLLKSCESEQLGHTQAEYNETGCKDTCVRFS